MAWCAWRAVEVIDPAEIASIRAAADMRLSAMLEQGLEHACDGMEFRSPSRYGGRRSSREGILREGIMYHFATTLIAGIIATVLVSSIVPTSTEAATLSDPQRVALEKATAACKVEAKGMKFTWHWRKRQKYVQNCIIRSASQQGIDISEIRRAVKHGDLLSQDIDDWSFVFSRSRNR
jgi:hypothetical protein